MDESILLLRPVSGTEDDRRDFVKLLYRRILEREGDPGGIEDHVASLGRGVTPAELIDMFIGCDEYRQGVGKGRPAPARSAVEIADEIAANRFPLDYKPWGEAWRGYEERVRSGFLARYCSGDLVLDIGYSGYGNDEGRTAFPHAVGIDLETPGYDGLRLPYGDGAVDTVFSSHALEHFDDQIATIREWYRVLRVGGYIVCMVPSQPLYEKKLTLPSFWNGDHKRMYTPASLMAAFEEALPVNGYRLRHLRDNDKDFDYRRGPDLHSSGSYEIELVIQKIALPDWTLAA